MVHDEIRPYCREVPFVFYHIKTIVKSMYTYLICLSDLVWNTWQIQTRVSGKTVWWVDHLLKMACCEKNIEDNVILLYLSGSMCPSIVLFSGWYLNVRPTKFKGPFNWNLSLLFELRNKYLINPLTPRSNLSFSLLSTILSELTL